MTVYLVTTEHGTQITIDTEKKTVFRKHKEGHPNFRGDYALNYALWFSGSFDEVLRFPLSETSSWHKTDEPVVGESMFFQERGLRGAYYQTTEVRTVEVK